MTNRVAKLACLVTGALLFLISILVNVYPDADVAGWGLSIPHGARVTEWAVIARFLLPLSIVVSVLACAPQTWRILGARAWRGGDVAAIAAVLLAMALTLVPSGDLGRRMVLYLSYATGGFSLLVIGLWPRPLRWAEKVFVPLVEWGGRLRTGYFLAGLFLLVFVPANLVSYFVFEHVPHVQDSIAQLFQAILFANGRVSSPAPPHADFFEQTFVMNGPEWYSMYPPGHSAMLAVGVFAGMPWIVNPLLGGLAVVLLYLLGKEVYGEVTGRIAASLAAVSPFVLFMSSEFMNHSSSLVFVILFLLGYARLVREPSWPAATVAGIGLGAAVCVRPLTAVALAVPFVVYALALVLRAPRRFLPPFVLLALSAAVPLAGFLAYNQQTTGDPFTPGYLSAGHSLGFGRGAWGPAHTPLRGLAHALIDLNALQKHLFEWPLPSLLLAAIPFALSRRGGWDWLLLTSWLSLVVAYFFYWFEHICFGPRFHFEAVAALTLLTAHGVHRLPEFLQTRLSLAVPSADVHRTTTAILGMCVFVMLATNLPPLVMTYSDRYWNVSAQLYRAVEEKGIRNALVFVNSNYSEAFLGNFQEGVDLRGDVVYARNLAGAGPALMREYPRRRYYLAEGAFLNEIDDPADLLPAQAKKWDASWQLDQCDAEKPTGLMRSYAGKRFVLRTHPIVDGKACKLERNVVVERGVPQFLALSVAADVQPDADWQLRVYVDNRLLDVRTIENGDAPVRWQELRYDLSPYAGKEVSVRLENLTNGKASGSGYWASARVVSEVTRAGGGETLPKRGA
jgi:hypothetical protein